MSIYIAHRRRKTSNALTNMTLVILVALIALMLLNG